MPTKKEEKKSSGLGIVGVIGIGLIIGLPKFTNLSRLTSFLIGLGVIVIGTLLEFKGKKTETNKNSNQDKW